MSAELTKSKKGMKSLAAFTKAVAQQYPVAEALKGRPNTASKVARVISGNREAVAEKRTRLQTAVDAAYAIKDEVPTVRVRSLDDSTMPSVLISDTSDGTRYIGYTMSPASGASGTQTLAFEGNGDGKYDIMYYSSDAGSTASTPIDFESLSSSQQDSLVAMVEVVNQQVEADQTHILILQGTPILPRQ